MLIFFVYTLLTIMLVFSHFLGAMICFGDPTHLFTSKNQSRVFAESPCIFFQKLSTTPSPFQWKILDCATVPVQNRFGMFHYVNAFIFNELLLNRSLKVLSARIVFYAQMIIYLPCYPSLSRNYVSVVPITLFFF